MLDDLNKIKHHLTRIKYFNPQTLIYIFINGFLNLRNATLYGDSWNSNSETSSH